MSDPRSEPTETVTPIRELERREIVKALRVTKGSVQKAAKLLGMGRATLYRRLEEMGRRESSVEQRSTPFDHESTGGELGG